MRCPVVAAGAAMLFLFASHSLLSQTLSQQFVVPQQLSGVSTGLIGVGDLNGDGRPDILYQTNALVATGNGTFKSIAETENFAYGSQLVDVNGDGKLDVVSAVPAGESCNQFPNGEWDCVISSDALFAVYLGNGDGTFQSGKTIDLGQEGSGTPTIAMVDLNGDGKPDAMVNFSGVTGDDASASAFEMINGGGGTFSEVDGGSPPGPVVAVGDFNGDGKMDIAEQSGGLQILYNLGAGRFTLGPSYPQMIPIGGATADFNHDGHPDLVVVDGSGQTTTGGVWVLFGQTGGGFTTPKRLSSFLATSVVAADLNHDGYPDIVAMGSSFSLLTNQKNGKFSNPRLYTGFGFWPYPNGFGAADFNLDGYLDLVFGNKIVYGTSGGNFKAPVITQTANPLTVATGDFNGDGIEDVATVNTVTVFTGSGKGYLNAGKTFTSGLLGGNIAAGDVNGDGVLDLIVTRGPTSPTPDNADVSVLLGNGDGTFRTAIASKVLGPAPSNTLSLQTYAIDVNHDGRADLIGDWGVALGHGDGTFKTPTALPSQAIPVAGIAVGDFNRDGNEDIVAGSHTTPKIFTLLGDGHGNFTVANTETLNYNNPTLNALTAADVNGDGIPDLVYEYSATPSIGDYDRVVVEFGDGTGKFGNATGVRLPYYNGSGNDSLFVADFNRDGNMDIVDVTVTDSGGPTRQDSLLIPGTGGGQLGSARYFPLQMVTGAMLDLNGDGAPDIVGPTMDKVGLERVLNTGAQP